MRTKLQVAGLTVGAIAVLAGAPGCSSGSKQADLTGTTRSVTVTMGACPSPKTLVIDGHDWVTLDVVPDTWTGGSTHQGRIHFDSRTKATFTAGDGTTIHYLGDRRLKSLGCVADAQN